MKAPSFAQSLADALRHSTEERGVWAFIPWWLITCLVAPLILYYFSGRVLTNTDKEGSLVAIFAAYAVLGGFLGSVSIAVLSQIYKTVSTYPFSDFLREEKIFDIFLFMPLWILSIQIFFTLVSTLSALAALSIISADAASVILYVETGLLLYVATKTWSLADLIRQLMWHYEEYTRIWYEESKS